MKRPEQTIQQACVKWFRIQHPYKILFAVNNNATSRSIDPRRAGGIAKSMGVFSGVADLVLCIDGTTYFIEVKAPKGRQSESQKAFQEQAEKNHFEYYIIYSLDEFINLIKRLTQ